MKGKSGRGNLFRAFLVAWALSLLLLTTVLLRKLTHLRTRAVPTPLSGAHQVCVDGACSCESGYTGSSCEEPVCEAGCERGECTAPGFCHCEDGWKGPTCSQAICIRLCGHGSCTQPYFCKCEENWHGAQCSKRCEHGTFVAHGQQCLCDEGWQGESCSEVACIHPPCVNGICQADHTCACVTGYSGADCSVSTLDDKLSEIWKDLQVRLPDLPAVLLHAAAENSEEAWRVTHQWTANLDVEYHVGRNGLFNALPTSDPLQGARFRTCVAVGNSGALRGSGMGAAIDAHEAVMRFNNALTKGFELDVGRKATFEMLNKRAVDSWADAVAQMSDREVMRRAARARPWPKRLLWRAESFHHLRALKQRVPFENPELVHPELLVHAVKLFSTIIERLAALHDGVMVEQRAPMGFVGAALLLQICDSVTLVGFDAPVPPRKISYHYYDAEPTPDPLAGEVEFLALQMLQRHNLIRLCTVDKLAQCNKVLPEALQLQASTVHEGDSRYRDVADHGEHKALSGKEVAAIERAAAADHLASGMLASRAQQHQAHAKLASGVSLHVHSRVHGRAAE